MAESKNDQVEEVLLRAYDHEMKSQAYSWIDSTTDAIDLVLLERAITERKRELSLTNMGRIAVGDRVIGMNKEGQWETGTVFTKASTSAVVRLDNGQKRLMEGYTIEKHLHKYGL